MSANHELFYETTRDRRATHVKCFLTLLKRTKHQ
ncbi:hypothetical protein SLEP1_g57027 [Rubroshorea leprosula]|uniref:Uncharacterized protein n=1 Tax=Rubroshorea leprosula TaxID=152421 RepID=A0AAV5MNZ6_9ROSI|nr:hypothetical protein SLEP1_g57027 [Rubroshorea leprosula]